MSLADALSGVLHLRPGRARPHSLTGSRPDWAETLARGRPASVVPGVLASVYSLCGHAHRLCAGLALQAAQGQVGTADADAARALQRETQREHVRRMGLDWVRQLTGPAEDSLVRQAAASLQCCPVLLNDAANPDAMRRWTAEHLLGQPVETWLAAWQQAGGAALAAWAACRRTWLARVLDEARLKADRPLHAAPALRAHASPADLMLLARHLRDDSGYTRAPHWHGRCAETGSWTRLHETRPMPRTPWERLGARIAELVRLSLPDEPGRGGIGWLSLGACTPGVGEGLAWVEMARGLLVHHATVEPAPLEPRVARYRVLAPTEWNFHPQGAVAQALESLDASAAALVPGQVAGIMAAYDPCVRFELELPARPQETLHA